MLKILNAKSKNLIEKCFEVRKKVFHEEQKISLNDEFDGKDKDAIHILAILNNNQLEPQGC